MVVVFVVLGFELRGTLPLGYIARSLFKFFSSRKELLRFAQTGLECAILLFQSLK